jgi:predicted ester cyclase
MTAFLDRLFQVWTDSDGLDEMEDRLAEFYADPVRVNGSDLSLSDLATRARALHAAFSDRRSELLQVVDDTDTIAVAFLIHGRTPDRTRRGSEASSRPDRMCRSAPLTY